MRLCFLLGALVTASAVMAQSGPPVILIHGIKSNDLTWQVTADALEADGWGSPYTAHADLNASSSTDVSDDIVLSSLVPTAPGEAVVPVRAGDPAPLTTRLFLVNFEAVFRDDTLRAHVTREEEGRSESNESGILKQGAALGQIIGDVLTATGENEVVLVGHSMGGLAIREYLQRLNDDSEPRWWVEPNEDAGHRVRAVVTYGTPHQGSNSTNFSSSIGSPLLPDGRSEAVRDLRWAYRLTSLGQGRYLYGGEETETPIFFSMDVTADGDENDTVIGLNAGDHETPYAMDNPVMPLPRDIAYTYLVGRYLGLGTDGVVDAERQVLQRLVADGETVLEPDGIARRIITNKAHTQQTSDADAIRDALAVATSRASHPTRDELEMRVGPNPVAHQATVWLDLPTAAMLRVTVVDMNGREVARLADGPHPAGPHQLDGWPDLAPGVYALVADVGETRVVRRVAVVR